MRYFVFILVLTTLLISGCSETLTYNDQTLYEEGLTAKVYFCPTDNCDMVLKTYIDYAKSSVHCAFFDLDLKDLITFGASPRASIYLSLAAKAHAFLRRRGYVTPEDVRSIGMDVMRHRIILSYEAEAEEVNTEEVIRKVLNRVEVP